MSKEILQVVDAVSNERGVAKEVIFEAIEAALASAAKKLYDKDIDVRVSIDPKSGEYQTLRRWQVIADDITVESPDRQIPLRQALMQHQEAQIGGYIETPLPNVPFGRIAAQTAKQILMQKVRDAERAHIVSSFLVRKGELISGIVKRIERGHVYLDIGNNVEALIHKEDMIPREPVHLHQRIRGYLKEVRSEPRGPQLFVSRVAPEFLIALFTIEVPEVNQGIIEIKGAARDPGSRAKIAVRSKDPRIDPVGACVGMRGSRVQSVSNELNGERIDIVLWDEDPLQFVIKAMAPAEVVSIVVDEDAHSMDIAVAEDKLSAAIGKGGQNIRLASALTGWDLNVMTEAQARVKSGHEEQMLKTMFVEKLMVDDDVAAVLVREGFSSIEEVAYVPTHEMLDIEEFDAELIEHLRERARYALQEVLLQREIAAADQHKATMRDDLHQLDIPPDVVQTLVAAGIHTREQLAELAVDDLMDLIGMDPPQAAQLIMAARAPWFEQDSD